MLNDKREMNAFTIFGSCTFSLLFFECLDQRALRTKRGNLFLDLFIQLQLLDCFVPYARGLRAIHVVSGRRKASISIPAPLVASIQIEQRLHFLTRNHHPNLLPKIDKSPCGEGTIETRIQN